MWSTHKVEENIFRDEPRIRHPLTAYVCCECFGKLMGPFAVDRCAD